MGFFFAKQNTEFYIVAGGRSDGGANKIEVLSQSIIPLSHTIFCPIAIFDVLNCCVIT